MLFIHSILEKQQPKENIKSPKLPLHSYLWWVEVNAQLYGQ